MKFKEKGNKNSHPMSNQEITNSSCINNRDTFRETIDNTGFLVCFLFCFVVGRAALEINLN